MDIGKTNTEALQLAISAVRDAEYRLREATTKAANSGAYDTVVLISNWAKSLQSLLIQVESSASAAIPSAPSSRSTEGNIPVNAPQPTMPNQSEITKRRSRKSPLFWRDADFLIKSARSRKTRSEYEHRVPADVIFTVAEGVTKWKPSKKLVTGDQILDAYKNDKGAVISYQVYSVIAWLTQLGLIRRHGRSGYSALSPGTIIDDVKKAWNELGAKPVQ